MDFNSLNTKSFIKDLKCSMCKNYLSYFPVRLINNNLNVCGRCEVPKDPKSEETVPHAHNKVYEIVAEEIIFPCRYVSEGCTVMLPCKDIPHHEDHCPLQLVKCPANLLDSCNLNVALSEVSTHCKEAHKDLILIDQKFEIDLTKSAKLNNIVVDGDCFVFKREFDAETKNLLCTLISNKFDFKLYNISLQNDDVTFVKNLANSPGETKMCLNFFEAGNATIKCQLFRGKTKENNDRSMEDIRQKISNIFECNGCHKVIRPPIKMFCKEEKISCVDCVPRHCNYTYFTNSEKFNRLAESLLYNCRYSKIGCKYISHPSDLEKHECSCSFKTIDCPLGCKWKGTIRESVLHISRDHQKNFAHNCEFYVNINNFHYNQYVLKFANFLFRLTLIRRNNHFGWFVQKIGDFQDDFKYEIEVYDLNDNTLSATKWCSSLKEVGDLDQNEVCCFVLDQFQSMLLNLNTVRFRVRIFRR